MLSGTAAIVNSGVIAAGGSGSGDAILANGNGGTIKLTNTGKIEGDVDASKLLQSTIVNKGEIVGDVDLALYGAPNLHDGRGGTVSGTVYGGGDDTIWLGADGETASGEAGDDTIYGGAGADTLIGGGGVNHLDGHAGADVLDGAGGVSYAVYSDSPDYVVVNLLTGTASHGDAQGDTLIAIHGVIGSNFDDTLTADNVGDLLWGGGGDDVLIGGAGRIRSTAAPATTPCAAAAAPTFSMAARARTFSTEPAGSAPPPTSTRWPA